jgi:V/A-type H+-transporting ATPase subunit C
MPTAIRTYAFINAKLRARISKLLPSSLFVKMARAYSLQEALTLLRDTPYSILDEIYRTTGDLKLGELELLKEEVKVFLEVTKHVSGGPLCLVQALLLGYEMENVKNALRLFFDRKIRNRSVDTSALYLLRERIIHDVSIDRIINAENLGELLRALASTPYGSLVEEQGERVLSEGTLFRLEIALDHFYYKNLLEKAGALDSRDRREALRIIGVEIDLVNINWIIRFRRFYNLQMKEVMSLIIPSGYHLKAERIQEAYTSQNVTNVLQDVIKSDYPGLSALLSSQPTDSVSRLLLVERVLERILMYETGRILMGYPFTIGVILAYFIFKKSEIKKVRAVLNAKLYKIPEDRIEDVI